MTVRTDGFHRHYFPNQNGYLEILKNIEREQSLEKNLQIGEVATGVIQGNRKFLLNQIAKWNLTIKCLAVAISTYFKYSDIMSLNNSLIQHLCPWRFVNF